MRNSRFLVTAVLIFTLATGTFAKCLKPANFSWPPILEPYDCPIVQEPAGPQRLSAADGEQQQMVQITFDCGDVKPQICDKAKKANDDVAAYITSAFLLREPIKVKMEFTNELYRHALGANVPGTYIPAQDSDKLIRLYPQALYKQFQFPQHPQYEDFDIHVLMSTNIWWHFPSDPPFMFSSDSSYAWTALHEILHGMGFGSCWFQRQLALLPTLIVSGIGTSYCYIQVRECAFDRYLQTPVILDPPYVWGPVSQFVHDFTTSCSTQNDLWEKFESSTSYQFGIKLLETAQNKGLFNIRLPNFTPVVLESGKPYSPGRSLQHVEEDTYYNTEDFLMTPYQIPGTELTTKFKRQKGKSVFGKSALAIMNSMGYPTPENPNPEKPKYIDPDK